MMHYRRILCQWQTKSESNEWCAWFTSIEGHIVVGMRLMYARESYNVQRYSVYQFASHASTHNHNRGVVAYLRICVLCHQCYSAIQNEMQSTTIFRVMIYAHGYCGWAEHAPAASKKNSKTNKPVFYKHYERRFFYQWSSSNTTRRKGKKEIVMLRDVW